MTRCPWCAVPNDKNANEIYASYHDNEWGVPLKDEARLFELLLLEGAQAGLSWLTILKRREGYRAAFGAVDGIIKPEIVAAFTQEDEARLATDERIIRNKRKIKSAINNARLILKMEEDAHNPHAFSDWLWAHVDNTPIVNHFRTMQEISPWTPLAERISVELKQMGFSFVGKVIMYSFMQSAGLVNDHLVSCDRHAAISAP